MENLPATPVLQENEIVAFKCLHYSVTESAGTVSITVVKKTCTDYTFGIRTKDGTAKSVYDEKDVNANREFDSYDEIVTMKKRDMEKIVEITIFDNHDWQPDLDFFVELYDTKTN